MFYANQTSLEKNNYQKYLNIVGSLSNLFSESKIPYLYYRVAEKIFCDAFNAEDLSRSDVSADAKKKGVGIGLKTFLAGNHKSFQKVAEFNSDRPNYINLKSEMLIREIARLRNIRIRFTENAHHIDHSIYHCIIREENKFKIFEEEMSLIDRDNISILKDDNRSIIFNDGIHDYSFLLSKSTLTKRFITTEIVHEFDVNIIRNPLRELESCLQFHNKEYYPQKKNNQQKTVYLPLYGRNHTVFPRSGLNQWNAKGRLRDANEVYIPIPLAIHTVFPDFFPDRNTRFNLKLPSGESLPSKICQQGGKALMSYSNKELGLWILRDILEIEEKELVTNETLQEIGIDSMRVDKVSDLEFEINFSKKGTFEKFKTEYL